MTLTKRTARLTGLAYLGLAVSGLIGFLGVRAQLYAPGDADATTANLVGHVALARLGIAADLTVVLTQAAAALGFFLLFRGVHAVAAGAIAAFGLVNSVVVMAGTVFSATALDVVLADAGAEGDRTATAQHLYELSGAAWSVGGLFFGLWLIPMGLAVLRVATMPRPLGWVLVAGGVGYVLSTYIGYLAPGLTALADAIVVPATIGELWMIGHLLWSGLRSGPAVPPAALQSPAAGPRG